MAKIGIVTVLYNSESVLEDFFKTLNEQTYKDFILYLVDNDSKDNSVILGQKLQKTVDFECKWLLQKNNYGVAKGNNIGILEALNDQCEYILLANNDIFIDQEAVEELLKGMIEYNFSMAVPKIYIWNTNKKIWSAGGGFKWLQNITYHRGENHTDVGQYDSSMKIDYAPTCFMLIKSSVFNNVGLMDENYFVYFDDTDFVWRATKYKNETLGYVYKSLIWHKVSSCTGGVLSNFTTHYFNRNHIYFTLKHLKGFHRFCVLLYIYIHYYSRKIRLHDAEILKLIHHSHKEGWNIYKKYRNENP